MFLDLFHLIFYKISKKNIVFTESYISRYLQDCQDGRLMLTLLELPLDLIDLTDCLDMVDTVEALRVTVAECCLLGMLDTVDCLLGRGLVWGNIGMVGMALLRIIMKRKRSGMSSSHQVSPA